MPSLRVASKSSSPIGYKILSGFSVYTLNLFAWGWRKGALCPCANPGKFMMYSSPMGNSKSGDRTRPTVYSKRCSFWLSVEQERIVRAYVKATGVPLSEMVRGLVMENITRWADTPPENSTAENIDKEEQVR